MKRAFKISDAAQAELLCRHRSPTVFLTLATFPFGLINSPVCRLARLQTHTSAPLNLFPSIIPLFSDKLSQVETKARQDLNEKVSLLRDELVQHVGDFDKVTGLLEEKGDSLFRRYFDGSAFIELLKQLMSWRHLAIEVLFCIYFTVFPFSCLAFLVFISGCSLFCFSISKPIHLYV